MFLRKRKREAGGSVRGGAAGMILTCAGLVLCCAPLSWAEDVETPRVSPRSTERYLRSIDGYLGDLRQTYRVAPTRYLRIAVWHERYARRIERLPTSGVDDDALQYGRMVASQLRDLAASTREVGLRAIDLERQIAYRLAPTPTVWGYHAGFGVVYHSPGWSVRTETNLREIRERQLDVVEETSEERRQIWRTIDADRQALVEDLRERFGRTFDREN